MKTFHSKSEFEADRARRDSFLNPSPPPIKPLAVRLTRDCLVQGRKMREGSILVTWPQDPPRGAGFLSARDAEDMVNGLHAEPVNETELAAFINSNLSDQ